MPPLYGYAHEDLAAMWPLEQSSNPALMERWGFTQKYKLQTGDQWEFQANIDSL